MRSYILLAQEIGKRNVLAPRLATGSSTTTFIKNKTPDLQAITVFTLVIRQGLEFLYTSFTYLYSKRKAKASFSV